MSFEWNGECLFFFKKSIVHTFTPLTSVSLKHLISSILESASETCPLVSSFLFKCNLYKFVSRDDQKASAQCMLCKQIGLVKFIKGSNTSNFNIHLKVIQTLNFTPFPLLFILFEIYQKIYVFLIP